MEKAAYTWFNRLIAIKILSKNGGMKQVSLIIYRMKLIDSGRTRKGKAWTIQLLLKKKQRLQLLLTDYEKEKKHLPSY
ncbi:MAG: BREX-1 system adenine-specific DNA-methyltransferase PglX [Chitinophagaceae bacterium]|nr:BREX-1 system adenine-specific DNA-methyltransferase PglX [Chitinophagaceae bacterium]